MYAFHILARVVENRRINQMGKGEFVLLLARDRVNESHSKYKNNMISTKFRCLHRFLEKVLTEMLTFRTA